MCCVSVSVSVCVRRKECSLRFKCCDIPLFFYLWCSYYCEVVFICFLQNTCGIFNAHFFQPVVLTWMDQLNRWRKWYIFNLFGLSYFGNFTGTNNIKGYCFKSANTKLEWNLFNSLLYNYPFSCFHLAWTSLFVCTVDAHCMCSSSGEKRCLAYLFNSCVLKGTCV